MRQVGELGYDCMMVVAVLIPKPPRDCLPVDAVAPDETFGTKVPGERNGALQSWFMKNVVLRNGSPGGIAPVSGATALPTSSN